MTLAPSVNHQNCRSDKQVAPRRQSGGRAIDMMARGLSSSPEWGTVVATVITQWWTLLVGQRKHTGGMRDEAQTSLKLKHNVYRSTHFFTGRPMADHRASSLRPAQLPRLSDLRSTNVLSELCTAVLNMSKTSRRSWHPLHSQIYERTREAQRSQVK